MLVLATVLALVFLLVAVVVRRKRVSRSAGTWKQRGESRGRTPGTSGVRGHASKTEPEATLHIKVTRADGRVEEYTAPATYTGE